MTERVVRSPQLPPPPPSPRAQSPDGQGSNPTQPWVAAAAQSRFIPKVMAPFVDRPGVPPRTVQIERYPTTLYPGIMTRAILETMEYYSQLQRFRETCCCEKHDIQEEPLRKNCKTAVTGACGLASTRRRAQRELVIVPVLRAPQLPLVHRENITVLPASDWSI
eukprot:6643245-Pyramimonas_sp.AAC.2